MGQVFLSYAREDRLGAERIARTLQSAGHEVWWDKHLDGGEEFSAEIEAALDKSDAIVVAWSAQSVKSRWVRDEAAVGGDTGRLVPVTIDGTLPPMGFRQFHTLDLSGWKGGKRDGRTAELLHSVERRLSDDGEPKPAGAPATLAARPAALTRGRLGLIAAALLLVIAAGGVFVFVTGRTRQGTAAAPTLALLPFTATSSDAGLRALAAQARDSVAHDLSDSGVPVRLLDSADSNGSIAPADYIMTAELSDGPDKTTATVRLEDSAQHVTVWTRQVDADLKDAGMLPERVGAQVAGSLTWGGALRNLDPENPALTAQLLKTDITHDPLQNYEDAARVAGEAPNSGMAQLDLAMYTAFALDALPRDQRADAVAAARRAAERAKSLVPHFGDVYIPQCVLHPLLRFAECENSLHAGLRADPDAPFVNNFLAYVLIDVGRTQEAVDRASLSYQHDPYMPAKISLMLRMLEVSGATRDADALYLQGIRWWPDWPLFRSRVWGILERGDFDALRKLEQEPGAGGYGPHHQDTVALDAALKARSVAQLRQTCADADDSFYAVPCYFASLKLGDIESAYALIAQDFPQRGGTPAEQESSWLDNPSPEPLDMILSPAAAPLRRDPRFLALADRTGLLAYWRSGHPPDFCTNKPEPVCAQLLKRS